MINISYYSEAEFQFQNMEEIPNSHPRSFIIVLKMKNNEQNHIKRSISEKLNKKTKSIQEIKIIFTFDQELNQYVFLAIFELKQSQLDLMSVITNLLMSRIDGLNFAITKSRIEDFQKLKKQIYIENKAITLQQLFIDQINEDDTSDFRSLLLFQYEVDSVQSLNIDTFIKDNLKTFSKLIEIICQRFKSLEKINQQEMPSQFQQELVNFLQEIINI